MAIIAGDISTISAPHPADPLRFVRFEGVQVAVPPERVSPIPRIRLLPAHDVVLQGDSAVLVQRILSRLGLDHAVYRDRPLDRRVPACLRALQVARPAEALALLDRRPQLLYAAANALLIGVSGFFRDPALFSQLRERHLPRVLATTDRPRIWSAACSDGRELYSIAMLLAEAGSLEHALLLGTDCRREALVHAARGRYSSIDGLESALAERYISFSAGAFQVSELLRRRAIWRCSDVLSHVPAPTWDIILCRNLAIYLQPQAAERLWRILTGSLGPGGILVVGKAERLSTGPSLARVGPCCYVKR